VKIRVTSIVVAAPTCARFPFTDGASFALKSFERVVGRNPRQSHGMWINERYFRNEQAANHVRPTPVGNADEGTFGEGAKNTSFGFFTG